MLRKQAIRVALIVQMVQMILSPFAQAGSEQLEMASNAPYQPARKSSTSQYLEPSSLDSPQLIGPAYALLTEKANSIEKKNQNEGWSYIISGGIVLALTIPAYYATSDEFAQAVYAIGQTIGALGVSYGAYLALLDNDYERFKKNIDAVPDLSPKQKEQLSLQFFAESAAHSRSVRKILVIGTSLTAALNFQSGINYSDPNLKTAFYFIGSINLLAAMSLLTLPSEEEKNYEKLIHAQERVHADRGVTIEPVIGPIVGMSLHF